MVRGGVLLRLGPGLALALAACNTPTPTLRIVPGVQEGQPCPSTMCAEVPVTCRSVISIRIFDPEDPTAPSIDQCTDLPFDSARTMCSVASVPLENKPLPVRRLEVQVALFPASSISSDPDNPSKLKCPHVDYNETTGYPIDTTPSPAAGGRAYYQPGDEIVEVELGCTHLELVNEACMPTPLGVTVRVDDFDLLTPIPGDPQGPASQLKVSVGEPTSVAGAYVLTAADSRSLRLISTSGEAVWSDEVDLRLEKYVCVEVVETMPQATPALRCRPAMREDLLKLRGVRLPDDTLQQVLAALDPTTPPPLPLPDAGLTIGVVVDQEFHAVPGVTVSSSAPGTTVRYLSNTGTLVGGATSNSGIFVSRDAPFGTMFSTSGADRPTVSGLGGLVKGHATIVVLQYNDQL